MKTVKLQDIKDKLIVEFRRRNLIPIIGSGFTRDEKSKKGHVPDVKKCCDDMINLIIKNDSGYKKEFFPKDDLSKVSRTFFKRVSKDDKRKYWRDFYTEVRLSKIKKDFLNIDWMYIYTLNVDDAIEKNSKYTEVINIKHDVSDDIFDEKDCVIKLHGDANYCVKYSEDELIFDVAQYVNSITTNKCLLAKLKNDYMSNNLLYIGCSLSSELDILSSVNNIESIDKDRYFVTNENIDNVAIDNLESYGINCIIKVDKYQDFYKEIYSIWSESKKIIEEDLRFFNYQKSMVKATFEDNKPYLFDGKEIIENNNVVMPYFYIKRSNIRKTLGKIFRKQITFIHGSICSGKSYFITELALNLSNEKVYFFKSKETLNESAFMKIMRTKNAIIFMDNKCLLPDQLEKLLRNYDLLKRNSIFFVIAMDNNKEYKDKMFYLQNLGIEFDCNNEYLKTRLDEKETKQISKKLIECHIAPFKDSYSIIDNIVALSEEYHLDNKYDNFIPNMSTPKELAAMIILLHKNKVYSYDVAIFDLFSEFQEAVKMSENLICLENTRKFEVSKKNNSEFKYVLYADFWLRRCMNRIAVDQNYDLIAEAYGYIVEKIVGRLGGPDLTYKSNDNSKKMRLYKEYILFDNIDDIFKYKENTDINLILCIYKKLNKYLSSEENFLHQFAKCYIRCCIEARKNDDKILYLDEATRCINVAIHMFSERFETSNNEKVLISLDHAKYTRALIFCHKANVLNFSDSGLNNNAIDGLYEAFSSENNSYKYALGDKRFNKNNVISAFIRYIIANSENLDNKRRKYIQDVFNKTLLNEPVS